MSVIVVDEHDAEEVKAVDALRQALILEELLPTKHDDYHLMLRLIYIFFFFFCYGGISINEMLSGTSSSSYLVECGMFYDDTDFLGPENLTLRKQSKCGQI